MTWSMLNASEGQLPTDIVEATPTAVHLTQGPGQVLRIRWPLWLSQLRIVPVTTGLAIARDNTEAPGCDRDQPKSEILALVPLPQKCLRRACHAAALGQALGTP